MELNEKVARLQGKSFDNMKYRLQLQQYVILTPLRDASYVAAGITKNESMLLLWK